MEDTKRYRELLDTNFSWPCDYIFKFIVPKHSLEKLTEVFGHDDLSIRESKKGNFVSVTAKLLMNSAQDVLDKYASVSGIEGLISL